MTEGAKQTRLARLRAIRWRMLEVCSALGYPGATEATLYDVYQRLFPPVSLDDCRTQIDYLASAGMVRIDRSTDVWRVTLTHRGHDVADGLVPPPDGIGIARLEGSRLTEIVCEDLAQSSPLSEAKEGRMSGELPRGLRYYMTERALRVPGGNCPRCHEPQPDIILRGISECSLCRRRDARTKD